jgi:hypothetical protein
MDSPGGSQVRLEHGPSPLPGGKVVPTAIIASRVSRPLMHAMADAGVGRVAILTALPLVGIEQCTARWGVFGDAVLSCLTRHPSHDGGKPNSD